MILFALVNSNDRTIKSLYILMFLTHFLHDVQIGLSNKVKNVKIEHFERFIGHLYNFSTVFLPFYR